MNLDRWAEIWAEFPKLDVPVGGKLWKESSLSFRLWGTPVTPKKCSSVMPIFSGPLKAK